MMKNSFVISITTALILLALLVPVAVSLPNPFFVYGDVYNSTGALVPAGVNVTVRDVTANGEVYDLTDTNGLYQIDVSPIPNSADGDEFTCSASHAGESGSCSFTLNLTLPSQRCDIHFKGHDINVTTDYTGAVGGIRIDNATGPIPAGEDLITGKTYYIKYKIVNVGDYPESVDVIVNVSNATGWNQTIATHTRNIAVGAHINETDTWIATGIAAGDYNITVNASITGDVNPADNVRTRNVTLIPPALTNITVSPPTANPAIGDTPQFTATAKDQYGDGMPGINITWTSINTTVGNVSLQGYAITDSNGKAVTTFTAEVVGTTTITALNGSISGTADVTVKLAPSVLTNITVLPSTVTLNISDTQQFNATAKDQYGVVMQGITTTWTSSNPTVGSVSPASAVTGSDGNASTTFTANTAGTTTITAASGSKSNISVVTVNPNVIITSGPIATNISTNSATINWSTNIDTTINEVRWGTTSGSYPNTNSTSVTPSSSHSVTLTGLSNGTPYYYVVNSTAPTGNSKQSIEYSFTTQALVSVTNETNVTITTDNTTTEITFAENQTGNFTYSSGTVDEVTNETGVNSAGVYVALVNLLEALGLSGATTTDVDTYVAPEVVHISTTDIDPANVSDIKVIITVPIAWWNEVKDGEYQMVKINDTTGAIVSGQTATIANGRLTKNVTATEVTFTGHFSGLSLFALAGAPPPTPTTTTTPRRPGGGARVVTPAINVPVDPTTGAVTSTTTLTVEKAALTIAAGVIIKDAAGNPLATSITTLHTPTTADTVGAIAAYDLGPSGTTFSKPIDLVIEYDPADIPAGFNEKDLVVKMYDGTKWSDLPTTVDTAAHTATAKVSHFSIFALFAAAPVAPPPVITPKPTIPPVVTPIPTPPVVPPVKRPWGLIIGIIIAVIIVGAAAYYFYTKKKA